MKPFYRPIIKESWDAMRHHFYLWPLALLTSLVGMGGTFQVLFDLSSSRDISLSGVVTKSDFITSTFIAWNQSFDSVPWAQVNIADLPFLLFLFLLLAFIVAVAIVITSSEGGLMFAFSQIFGKRSSNYLDSFRKGLDKFWSLFAINLVYRLIYLIILAVIIYPLILLIPDTGPTSRLLLGLIVFLVLIPTVIILDLVARYSLMYIMVYNQSVQQSLYNAWLLFRTNWLISIETSILILVGLLGTFLLLTVVLLPLLVMFLTMFGVLVAFSDSAFQIFSLTGLVAVVLVLIVAVTLFTGLQMAVWIGVFKRLTTGEHVSKVHRLTMHAPWLHKPLV